MRAAILHEHARPLSIETIDVASPREGEVLVRLGASGVCHSDTFILSGQAPYPLPVIPGHEGAGVVEDVGPGVTDLARGDRVILSFRPQCGRCAQCTMGRPVLCTGHTTPASGMFDGTARISLRGRDVAVASRLGTFSEYAVVPVEQAIRVTDEVPMDVAALIGCGVTTGVCAVTNTAAVPAGASVVAIGCGGVGLCVVMGAALVGARQVVAVDVKVSKLAMAREVGATATLDLTSLGASDDKAEQAKRAAQALRDLTGGGADFAFDATGLPESIELAIDALAPRGTAVVLGLGHGHRRPSFDSLAAIFGERTIKGSWYGSSRPRVDFPRLTALYASGRLPLDRLVSRRYSLDGINDAFAALHEGDVARCVITFDRTAAVARPAPAPALAASA